MSLIARIESELKEARLARDEDRRDALSLVLNALQGAQKELQRGDLIVTINGQAVTTPAQVRTEVDSARRAGRKSVLLLIRRGNLPPRYIGLDIAPAR